jgi:membrane-bound ClpP family serine protease
VDEVDWLFDEPVVVLVGVTFAAVFAVVELALPTLGVAGLLGVFCLGVAGGGVVRQDDLVWWPLLGTAVAAVLWTVSIVLRRRSTGLEAAAAALCLAAGLGFAAANRDAASAVVAVALAAGLWVAYPALHQAATKLVERPAQTGMEALVGRTVLVDRWDGDGGIVLLDGTRWNAESVGGGFSRGDHAAVVDFHGSTMRIAAGARSGPPGAPPIVPPPSPPLAPS